METLEPGEQSKFKANSPEDQGSFQPAIMVKEPREDLVCDGLGGLGAVQKLLHF